MGQPRWAVKVTDTRRIHVIERDGLYCLYCGVGPMPVFWYRTPKGRVRLGTMSRDGIPHLTLDHVQAVARNGKSRSQNLRVACEPCNRAKGVSTLPPNGRLYDPAPMCLLPPRRVAPEWGAV